MDWSGSRVVYLNTLVLIQVYLVSAGLKCQEARENCGHRIGCEASLRNYLVECTDFINSNGDRSCPPKCTKALITLMSTDEGSAFIDCDCDGSSFCEISKEAMNPCRAQVLKAMASDSIVSCSLALSICRADPACTTAFSYYDKRCLRNVIHGKRCTKSCKHSLDILYRQEKAAKLRTCYCEESAGGKRYRDCQLIRNKTEQLCFREYSDDISPSTQEDLFIIASSAAYTSVHCNILLAATCALIVSALYRTLLHV